MLYDPKWEQQTETKADPFSLDSLIAWLEKQPPNERYCYTDIGHCLVAQYLNASGLATSNVNPSGYYPESRDLRFVELPSFFNEIAQGRDGDRATFGAALERARALRA